MVYYKCYICVSNISVLFSVLENEKTHYLFSWNKPQVQMSGELQFQEIIQFWWVSNYTQASIINITCSYERKGHYSIGINYLLIHLKLVVSKLIMLYTEIRDYVILINSYKIDLHFLFINLTLEF